MKERPRPVFQKSAEAYEPRGRLDPAGFDRHVSFHLHPPPAHLAAFLEHFWVIRWDGALGHYDSQEVMHRPYVDLFFSSQGSGIQGTFRGRRTYSAAGSGRIVGTRFRPGAFHAFWQGEMSELEDKVIDATRVFPWADRACVERVLALDDQGAVQALVELLGNQVPPPDATVDLIHQIILAVETKEELSTVAAVSHAFAKSERWLQQTFKDYLGIGLKWFLQRHRLLAAAERIRQTDSPDWAAIAYDLGYSSQQHFITSFKSVLGSTPRQYKLDLESKDVDENTRG
jgi:AraC-like DNA-binding protein